MEIKFPFTEEIAVRFDALFQWLNRRYQLQESTIRVGKQEIQLFTIPKVDDVIDRVLEESANPDEEIPYWTELWPSSLALAQFLNSNIELKGKSVLELGSGLGLVGIVAGKMGARVVLSDYLEDALRICELNWIANFGKLPTVWQLDWRNPSAVQQFDVLLASDVAYERRMFWALINTFQTLLKKKGTIYLSEPNRALSARFFSMLKEEGFVYKKIDETIIYRQKKMNIAIYTIRKSQ